MPRHLLPALLCLSQILGGCGIDSLSFWKDNDPGKPTDVEEKLDPIELCALYLAQDQNQGRWGTDDPGWVLCMVGPTTTGLDFSEESLQRECRPGTAARKWADDLITAIEEERVGIDWDKAYECIDGSRSLRTSGPSFGLVGTEAWEAIRTGPCQSFYEGLVPDGEPCTDDWDCSAGSGCYTDDPFAEKLCLKLGTQGEACDGTFHPCAPEFFCGEDFTCVPLGAANAPCTYDEDCLSGLCAQNELGQTVCAPVPPTSGTPIGELCTTSAECNASCVGCRPLEDGAPTTCEVLGGEGAYCRDWFDCVLDLGCVHSVCTYAAAGQDCAVSNASPIQGLCAPGLVCLPDQSCGALDEAACGGNSRCLWTPPSEYYGYYYPGFCGPNLGTCEALPESGDCLAGAYCAQGFYCSNGGTCFATAKAGEECDETGYDAPVCDGCDTDGFCSAGLYCTGGTCEYACEFNDDCGEGEYCDTWAWPPACTEMDPEGCFSDEECPSGSFCYVPGNACYDFDGDPEGCATLEFCTYDASYDYCDPTGDAFDGSCQSKLGTGEECAASNYGVDCESGYCSPDPEGVYRCEVVLDGCSNNNAGFLQFTFLFGIVWMGLRRLRRR